VERTRSFDVLFNRPVGPGCSRTSTGATSATTEVDCRSVPGAVGRAFGSTSTGGVLRSSAELAPTALVLDAQSAGATSRLSVVGRGDLRDFVSVTPLAQRLPASFTLFVDWDGQWQIPAAPAVVTPYASGFLGFRAAGFDPLARGWSGWTWAPSTREASSLVDVAGNASFDGSATRQLVGATTVETLAGRSAFDRIPITTAPFEFFLALVSEVMYENTGAAPVTLTGPESLAADFASTARIAGFQVFDAAGQDISGEVRVSFQSGFVVPVGAPTLVPEPSTLMLVAGGIALLGVVGRHNARRRSDVG
jgi:hypothetical protein